jgi:hypothetical protein
MRRSGDFVKYVETESEILGAEQGVQFIAK